MAALIEGKSGSWEIVDRDRGPRPGDLERQALLGCRDRIRRRAQHAGVVRRCRHAGHAAGHQRGLHRAGGAHGARARRPRSICRSVFERKNYFYADLPAGYQISQYKQPLVGEGHISIDLPDGSVREIGIERLHLEQDAGKSLHDQDPTAHLRRSQPLRRRPHGDRLQARPALGRGGGDLLAEAALDPALSRAPATATWRRARCAADVNVSVRRPGGRARHALRDQERELDPLRPAGDRVRGAPAGRAHRRRRDDPAGDPPLRCQARHHARDAHEGGGARLSLLPRSRSPAARARPGLGRGHPQVAARAAGREEGAPRSRARGDAL